MSELTESVDPALLASLRGDADAGGDRCWAVDQAVRTARDWLVNQQADEGYWCAELEGDTILESEYILLLTWLGQGQSEPARRAARYIAKQQLPTGGWAMFPGGPLEISGSVKAYWALKITGADPASEPMRRAKQAILAAGGVERVNSFTRYYLALLGILKYRQCPAVPPELMLIPRWAPFNIGEMSSWSRTIIVPLSILWAFQPRTQLPANIKSTNCSSTARPRCRSPCPCEVLDDLKAKHWVNWEAIFRGIDRCWKGVEKLRLLPVRKRAIRKAKEWMLERFEESDGLGAIFPPIIWSIVALRCLGFAEDSPEVQRQITELNALIISDGDTDRLQPCKSPVWDTSIALLALRDADLAPTHTAIRKAADWLLAKECRREGDWSKKSPHIEPSGWFFEFNNAFYPDVDDTAMVVMALSESLGGREARKFTATLVPNASRGENDSSANGEQLSTILSGRIHDTDEPSDDQSTRGGASPLIADLDRMRNTLDAMRRGVRWMLAMQSKNGGWGAFDADNTRELLTRVPFADHNAMIDPPTGDITARVLEMFGRLGIQQHPAIDRALRFVWEDQEHDHAWYGRWGVNYIYGTWQVIVGLTAIGVAAHDRRLQLAADWLEVHQQQNGGWGETARTYDEPHLRGTGPTTPSQTSWALMGLMAAGRTKSTAVERGIQYLIENQRADGTWDEAEFTGTGFPKVFYLRYHLYRHSFPLMALGRYRRLSRG
ncbi:MAG: terpene cyclase/mutase family protein [Planctomycetaceae bacterium]